MNRATLTPNPVLSGDRLHPGSKWYEVRAQEAMLRAEDSANVSNWELANYLMSEAQVAATLSLAAATREAAEALPTHPSRKY